MALSPDGTTLATSGTGGSILLWDIATGKQRRSWQAHQQLVTALGWSADGKILVSAGADATMLVWDVNNPSNGDTAKTTNSTPGRAGLAPKPSVSLVVCCDASLGKPMDMIVARYLKNSSDKIQVLYGGSKTLISRMQLTPKSCGLFVSVSDQVEAAKQRGIEFEKVLNLAKLTHKPSISLATIKNSGQNPAANRFVRFMSKSKEIMGRLLMVHPDDQAAYVALSQAEATMGLDEAGRVIRVIFDLRKGNNAGLVHLKGLKHLSRLYLISGKFTDNGMVHLKDLTELRYLELRSKSISITGLLKLKGLTKLEELHVDHLELTDAELKKLQQALPECRIHH